MNELVKDYLRGGKNGRGPLTPVPPAGRKQEETEKRSQVSKGKSGMLDENRTAAAADALRTLTRARQIQMDKKLMADVHAHAAEHVASINEALSGTVTRSGKGKR